MNGKAKAAIWGAGAVVSAAVLRGELSRAIDRNMIGEALDRQEPRTMQRIKSRMKGSPEDLALETMLVQAGNDLSARPHRRVELQSYDGTRLAGHLFSPEKPKRAIVAMHGWRSNWARDFGLVADFLHSHGCAVLYAEQRGQGSSEGSHMGFGILERHDCVEWAKWMAANGYGQLPLYLAGISMGASTVLMAAGSPDLPDNVRGILADCGFTSPHAIFKHVSEANLHLPYARRRRHVDALYRRKLALNPDAYSTIQAMENTRIPVLFIHGSEDRFVPVEMTMANYEACIAPKQLLIVDGASHAMSYLKETKKYEAAVQAFWAEQEGADN